MSSGQIIARLFHRLLAIIFLFAWISLAVQIEVLIGRRGLLPIGTVSDSVLVGGAWLGAALALLALGGVVPRLIWIVQVVLYYLYAAACRDFLSFQWDNLLLESALLAVFLPRDRPERLAHLLLRLLLFKLYFESGIAKWQSHLHDWQDGSAMVFYYETAPLPARLAYLAHNLPAWWHHLESRATLVVELVVPFLFFGPRRARLTAFVVMTGFQLVNAATANYGFFVYLALALHVFLLDEPRPPEVIRRSHRAVRAGLAIFLGLYVAVSTLEALIAFGDRSIGIYEKAYPVRKLYAPYRLINTYHLFGHITRDRIEPTFQTNAGGEWRTHHLRWKPGPLDRAPPYVAPHQPRVDFLLWFYGLGHKRGMPGYVAGLLRQMCRDPAAVESLFVDPLPRDTRSVRILFEDYRFSDVPGQWWTATPRGQTPEIPCSSIKSG